jgi:hypothetical protein
MGVPFRRISQGGVAAVVEKVAAAFENQQFFQEK